MKKSTERCLCNGHDKKKEKKIDRINMDESQNNYAE